MEASEELSKVNVNDLTSRFRSKKELHTFLEQDGKAFLPKLDCTNVYFLRDILCKKKEVTILSLCILSTCLVTRSRWPVCRR